MAEKLLLRGYSNNYDRNNTPRETPTQAAARGAVFLTIFGIIGCAHIAPVQTLTEDGSEIKLSLDASNCFSRASNEPPTRAGEAFKNCLISFESELPRKSRMQLVLIYQYYAYYQVCIRKQNVIRVDNGRVTVLEFPQVKC
ncbi:MAG: hypothetical protein IOC90_17680 [Methylocystis sp.]|nr:hypothetical protein [Methylocystis sp.]MCA3589838.1 hypothetical protein [Methylocystis sp.]MCA3592350.1 hypothetical protein [Methylocystis sp.]